MVADAGVIARRPEMGRDSAWLAGADLVAVFLALFGQVVLTRALWTESYGLFIIALDVFATLFLMIDLGLPTLLARDGSSAMHRIVPSIHRIYRLQFLVALPFVLLAIIAVPLVDSQWRENAPLVLICAAIAMIHIASYAPRSGLRAAGEARLEAWTKVLERGLTTVAYMTLYFLGVTSVSGYAFAFLFGASSGLFFALRWVKKSLSVFEHQPGKYGDMGPSWTDNRALLLQALPFAVTLGVLPYVVRIEKFIVSIELGVESAALFHVAQLAWLAGLVIPQALRAALLPVLGQTRTERHRFEKHMAASLDVCLGLLAVGIFAGALIVSVFLPVAFPSQYTDGTLGVSAVTLFMVLLLGWCFTLLSTPTYTALQAGLQPWRFTAFIGLVVAFAALIGFPMISSAAQHSAASGLFAAAVASTLSAAFSLVLSIQLSGTWQMVRERASQWILAIAGSSFACIGLVQGSLLALSGCVLVVFIPQALRAGLSTIPETTLVRTLAEE